VTKGAVWPGLVNYGPNGPGFQPWSAGSIGAAAPCRGQRSGTTGSVWAKAGRLPGPAVRRSAAAWRDPPDDGRAAAAYAARRGDEHACRDSWPTWSGNWPKAGWRC